MLFRSAGTRAHSRMGNSLETTVADTNSYSKSSPQTFSGYTESAAGALKQSSRSQFITWTDSLSGVKKRNWKKLIENHEDATTPMQASRMTVTHSDGYYAVTTKSVGQPSVDRHASGFVHSYFDPPSGNPSGLDVSEASRDASSKFYSNAQQALTQLQSGVVLGELKQTLSMIAGRGQSLKNVLTLWRNRLIKRRRGGKKAVQKQIADAWLELQFGWNPLAMDIAGALAAFKRDRTDVQSVNGYANRDRHISTQRDANSAGNSGIIVHTTGDLTSRTAVKIRGGVKLTAPGHHRTLEKFGLLPNSFAPTIWELVPWSFLIDYFTDLGGVIGALSFPQNALYYASTTQIREYKYTWIATYTSDWGASVKVSNETFIPQFTEWRKRAVIRTPGNPSIPMPTVRLPKHWQQWANLAALWVSRDLRGLKYLT